MLKRIIPTVVIYQDPEGIIPLAVNELLEKLWIDNQITLRTMIIGVKNVKKKRKQLILESF